MTLWQVEPKYGLVWLVVLTAAAFGQVQDSKAKTIPSKHVIRAESAEHELARTALEDTKVKAGSIKAEYSKHRDIEHCLMAKAESELGTETHEVCQLTEEEVNAAIEEHCTSREKIEKNYAACALSIHDQLSEPIYGILQKAESEIETLQARLEHADACAAVYRTTIDKRASDLTVRQADQVRMCKDLDQYPPPRK